MPAALGIVRVADCLLQDTSGPLLCPPCSRFADSYRKMPKAAVTKRNPDAPAIAPTLATYRSHPQ